MKFAGKFLIVLLLAVLILVPLQAAQAKPLLEGQVIFGSNYTLKSGETLSGDLVVFGGTITVEKDARVNGSVVLMGGTLSMDGEASEDVVVLGGAVKLGDNAHILGNLVTLGAPVDRAAGARIDGDIVNNPTSYVEPVKPVVPDVPKQSAVPDIFSPFVRAWEVFWQSFAMALLALFVVLFIPEQTRRVGEYAVARPIAGGSMGLLTILLYVVSIVALVLFSLLIITMLVTIPMIFILSVMLAMGSVFGMIGLGLELGLRLTSMLKVNWAMPLTAALGTFLVFLLTNSLGILPVVGDCIGWVLPTLAGLIGLGAVFMTRFGTRAAYLAVAPVPVEPAAPVENM